MGSYSLYLVRPSHQTPFPTTEKYSEMMDGLDQKPLIISYFIQCDSDKFKRLLVYNMLLSMVDYGIQSLA